MKKRFYKSLSVLLSVILLFSLFTALPFSVSAAVDETEAVGTSSGTTGECTWTLDDDGTLTISGDGKMGGYSWQWGTGMKNVIIENGVTNIGNYAFKDCKKLASVTIPDSVTDIGSLAFYGCIGLTSIDIPENVTIITWGALSGCTGLTSIDIPDSVTSIENYAFYGCTGLANIDIAESVKSIGEGAFGNCTGLTSVTIPNSVTYIGDEAFSGCADGFLIYGVKGSEAEKYANDNEFTFIEIEPEQNKKTGDVNGDNTIDVIDAVFVQKHSSGTANLSDEQLAVADVNNDGFADILDAAEIQKYASGKITEFKKKA